MLTAQFYVDDKIMPIKEKNAYKKRRGRPPGSRYAGNIPCRLSKNTLVELDEFADREGVTRSEAIRRLINIALAAPAKKCDELYQSAADISNINYIKRQPPDLITVWQVKAARALVGWSQSGLADHSRVSQPTIARLESLEGRLGGRRETISRIRAALESAGVEFTNGDQPGVRLRKPAQQHGSEPANQTDPNRPEPSRRPARKG